MILKSSEEYDSILHVGVDINFIIQVFTANMWDFEKGKMQLLDQYTKEYQTNLQNSATSSEKDLASVLNNRNIALIERVYATFKIKKLEKLSANHQQLSVQDALNRAELRCVLAENNLITEERQMSLLRVASNLESKLLWGKERNTWIYQQAFESKYARTEDGKVPSIEQLKIDLEDAQRELNDAYRYTKEQTLNTQDNTVGGIKR